ncbi:MAG: hypothetical protein CL949_11790 [Erythrobacter sp.]|nr:hypothetical protein [Erythrobacter sp.]|tara:strand:- start:898 stop:1209 length:312 start_codon:yes stop_codon:yes gene_type:complete
MPIEITSEVVAVIGIAGVAGWVFTTWLRIKNGYPLENSWGKAIYPKNDQAIERVKLLTQENAELRAELGSLKDRLGNVERIVTDSGYQLTSEIESLRAKREAN